MPTPNYGYEKRQKELAKKRKKEDKLLAKAHRKVGEGDDGSHHADGQGTGGEPASASDTPQQAGNDAR